jgi:DNA-binding Xre family transcriptional regulator
MRRVSVDELNALCDYLGCEVGDILKREDVPDA